MLQVLVNLTLPYLGTIIIGLITFLLARHYVNVKRYPKGPFPWPIVGNIPMFFGKTTGSKIFTDLAKKYNNIFTVHFGSLPFVVISSMDLMKEALLSRKDFDGRKEIIITEMIVKNAGEDIAFSQPGPSRDVLRKLGLTAVRKYVGSPYMPEVVRDGTDEMLTHMFNEDKSFNPTQHIYLMVFSMAASASFGNKYKGEDEEFLELKKANMESKKVIENGFPVDFIPMLRPFYHRVERRLKECLKTTDDIVKRKFMERKESYQRGDIRDFSDALLASREEAMMEDSATVEYMSDKSLKMVVNDLFGAGVDTTSSMINWAVIYMTKYPEIQERMAKEVEENIGDRMAVLEDRNKLPYIWAFWAEILRLRMAAPVGVPHKALWDTELAGQKIPKDTGLLIHYDALHKNPDNWDQPEAFRPERFLTKDGKYTTERIDNYAPFGLGRRSCVGEKLARANLFLVLVRLLQRVRFVADGPIDLATEDKLIVFDTKPYTLKVEERK